MKFKIIGSIIILVILAVALSVASHNSTVTSGDNQDNTDTQYQQQ